MAWDAVAGGPSRPSAWATGLETVLPAAPAAPTTIAPVYPGAAPQAPGYAPDAFAPTAPSAAPTAAPTYTPVPTPAPTYGPAPAPLPAPTYAPDAFMPAPPAPPVAPPPPPPAPMPLPAPAPGIPAPMAFPSPAPGIPAPAPAIPVPAPGAPDPAAAAIQALTAQMMQVQAQIDAILAPAPGKPAAPTPEPPKPAAPPHAPKPRPHPKPKPKPAPDLHKSRGGWFISQYGSAKYNSREDVPGIDNANCGPTSLTMVATAFGKIDPTAAQADAAIEKSRRMMGDGLDQRHGTSSEGIARGARAYGLDAKVMENADVAKIKAELAKGRLTIINGNYIRANLSLGGGHFYVVTKIEGNKAYLNDPAIPTGPRVISTDLLMRSIRTHWAGRLISIGK